MTEILGVGRSDATAYLLAQRALRCNVLNIDASEIETLVQERFEARQAKDFEKSDVLRAKLTEMGVEVRDSPEGSTWNLV